GVNHPWVARCLGNMSSVLQYTGKYEEALAVNQRVLAMDEATSGTDSPTIASPLTNIAEEEILLGRYQEAIRDLRRAIPLEESALGSQHQRVALSLGYLGEALARSGEYGDAEAALGRARGILEKTVGASHPRTALLLDQIAVLDQLRGRCRDAIELEKGVIAVYEKVNDMNPDLAGPLVRVGQCQLDLGRPRDAIAPLERAITIRTAREGDPSDLAEAEFAVGRAR